jgi:hypothetical protein
LDYYLRPPSIRKTRRVNLPEEFSDLVFSDLFKDYLGFAHSMSLAPLNISGPT